ncbi:site-2 protease family protein [Kocuria sp.]|uniref:site-2 protease family protein n=1 Tax=Kocuria sp. TaxID=1871328 RepID=UPI0026E0543C|nr:site-2 protease family protein [Kocuria sp.]MDO5619671.1 site-2 protease family protein [Kocuria sp.]
MSGQSRSTESVSDSGALGGGSRWRRPIQLGRVFGFPLHLDRSWFVIAAVIVLLYTPVLRRVIPDIGAWVYAVAAIFCLLLALSVLLHELAHAWAARAFGWPVTHITLSLMGGHTSFGQARTSWWSSLVISVVGPVANLVLGLLGWLILVVVAPADPSAGVEVFLVLLELTAWANWFVGVFNLIPGLPLDGGRALEAVVWGVSRREFVGTLVAAWTGRIIAAATVALLLVTGLWRSVAFVILAGLLVWMLLSGATAALRRARAARAMAGVNAADLMEPAISVPARTPLAAVELILREAFASEPGKPAPYGPVAVIVTDGTPEEFSPNDAAYVGLLNPARITAVPAVQRPAITVDAIMDPLPHGAVIRDDLAELPLLEFAARSGQGVFVVVDSTGTVEGVLRAGRLNEVLQQAGL